MKKIFAVVLLGMFALAGCNDGDNGELAGVYQAKNKDQMILSFNESDKNYKVDYKQFLDLTKVNKYAEAKYLPVTSVGLVTRNGEYLVMPSENNKKIFKIENMGLKAVYNNDDTLYIRSDSN
ncbi:hypothetical protein AB6G30_22395 [Providencia stuartii]|uniref:hypothetical protein n=2 Tax=Providencia stuartii TaxID=588 RepID=UPI0034DD83A1